MKVGAQVKTDLDDLEMQLTAQQYHRNIQEQCRCSNASVCNAKDTHSCCTQCDPDTVFQCDKLRIRT